jgi:PAS domain S-box-containing protein
MLAFLKNLFRTPANRDEPPKREMGRSSCAAPQPDKDTKQQRGDYFEQVVAGVRDYAIFLLDAQGNVASWNAGAERLKGYRAEEIIGQHFSRFYPAEAIASGWPTHELEVAAATGRFEDEGWRVRKDGSRFWANVVITPLRDASGQVSGFLKITRDLTERKEAEEKARRLLEEQAAHRAAQASAREAERAHREERRQREQLHVTLSSIGDAVIVTDTHGVVSFLNPVAQVLTGWEPREAAGQPLERVFRIFNEDTRLPIEDPVSKVLREGVVVGLANHTVLVDKNGREISIDDSGAPIRGEEGTIAGVVLVFRDVTETRRAMEARLRLAAIVESSEDAIISKNLDGIILSWNEGAERLFGYTSEEMVGRPLSMLVPPDYPDDLPAIMARLRRGERIDHYETVRMRKDGSRVDVSLTISPIKDTEGKIIGASKIARDISPRKRTEAALHFLAESSKALAELLDVSSTLQRVASLAVPHFADWCAVDLLEPDGSLRRVAVAHVDPAKVRLAQEVSRRFPPSPNTPQGPWHIVRTGRSEIVPEITDAILLETVKNDDYRRMLRELGIRSYIGVPLQTRGKILGVITFTAAESGHRYEPADLQLAEDLGQRAAVAIENARLYSDLKAADRRKDEFLAMLAHELRNPLAPIRNALHIMKMADKNGEAAEQARQMTERQVQHLVRLVDDLLDVSRVMRGRVELRKEPVELGVIIAHAVETAQPILDAQGQELVLSVPSESLRLEADPTRLAQVIGNLLNNAAKFSYRAGRVWLTAEREHDEAVVRVRDEGAGISPALLPHLFDLFVQGNLSLERSQGGLGIGLTIVRKLVELHGGKVTARSEGPGKGSEFVVRLPMLQGAAKPLDAGPRRDLVPQAMSRRVLIVDDNVDATQSMAVLLQLWGYEVRVAHSGQDALPKAEAFQPEVVLLDIGLPGMNGYEVAQRLRAQPRFDKTILIAVTGYGQEGDRRRSKDAGFNHHLTKPVDPDALQRLLAGLPSP